MTSKKKRGKERTFVVTAAQGIQNPYSARMYGRDTSKGAPNRRFIENMERYACDNSAEIQIHSIAGANVNEIELHPFFHNRDDVFIDTDAKIRNEQNRQKEIAKRENWETRRNKWIDREVSKAIKQREKEEHVRLRGEYGKEWKEHMDEMECSVTEPVKADDFRYQMPMHYFWENIPDTNWPLIGHRFNSNISTPKNLSVRPQNKNPLTGLNYLTKKYGGNSVIVASPKRLLTPVAKGAAGDYPHMLMTTGVCTRPNYNLGQLGIDAKEKHSYGFVVVNVLDDKIYLPRIVPAQENGAFVDLGIRYERGKDPERAEVVALDVGDSHCLEINPKVDRANMDMMKYLRPKDTFFNDVFGGVSVSVHDIKSPLRRAQLHRAGLGNLERELEITGEYITRNANLAAEWGGKIFLKWSNHDDMLYRWLDSGKYQKDMENFYVAHAIIAKMINRENCFETAVRMYSDIPDNVVFMKPSEDEKREGYVIVHGHQGKNGSRGSLKGLEDSYKKVSIGHFHTLQVLQDAYCVGTSTKIPLEYQLGHPSTSMAGNVAIYKGGLAQAIPIIKSTWAPKQTLEFLANK